MNIEKSTGLGNSGRFMIPNGDAISPPASNIPFNYDKGINSQVLSTQATNQFQGASIVPVSLQDAKDACGENGVKSYNKVTETNGNLGGTSNNGRTSVGVNGNQTENESWTCYPPQSKGASIT